VTQELAQLTQQRAPMTSTLEKASFSEITKDERLRTFALAQGRAAFGDNCAPCHGAGGGGAFSFPNLNDDDWIWGGSLEAIQQTIQYGIRSTHPDTRIGIMPAFAQILNTKEIGQLVNHVRALGGLTTENTYDKPLADSLFGEQCAACHGDGGKGNIELGAPNLVDSIWLFGSDKASILQTLARGRASMMPAWNGRLDDTTIKALSVYVQSLGGVKTVP
jgi:cytochrome c oxidase cbb3-type subunit 3